MDRPETEAGHAAAALTHTGLDAWAGSVTATPREHPARSADAARRRSAVLRRGPPCR
jgi:hypothetical protein